MPRSVGEVDAAATLVIVAAVVAASATRARSCRDAAGVEVDLNDGGRHVIDVGVVLVTVSTVVVVVDNIF